MDLSLDNSCHACILYIETKEKQYLPDNIRYVYSVYTCNVNNTTYNLVHGITGQYMTDTNLYNLQTKKFMFDNSIIETVDPITINNSKNITACFIAYVNGKQQLYSLTENKILLNGLKFDSVWEYRNLYNSDESDIRNRRLYQLSIKDNGKWFENYLLDDLTLEYDEFKERAK